MAKPKPAIHPTYYMVCQHEHVATGPYSPGWNAYIKQAQQDPCSLCYFKGCNYSQSYPVTKKEEVVCLTPS